VHEDGTARIQAVDVDEAPRFHQLIKVFANRTGVPMLLNTSFNSQEPIVCTPEHALRTFLETDLDGLVIGDFMVDRPQ
jgi:carbamoyltransferase